MKYALVATSSVLLVVGGCAPPAKRTIPVVKPAPPLARLAPAKPQDEGDWRDLPLTPGSWTYVPSPTGSSAAYGLTGAPVLTIRCDPVQHVVTIGRPAPTGNTITIRTSYGSRTVAATPAPGGMLVASIAARDPLLDQIAFSRGRFSLAGSGLATLYLPAWAEPARVTEDCRG